ncbi:MAG: hypothetical protein DRJ68_00270 [Thermoprotei archaeon]|nr:MAG: hypothetical protein DRJ68_00270 [Thermoprotei archaeon]
MSSVTPRELVEELSKSPAHLEALYMYLNKGSFPEQCIEELELRWPGLGYRAWREVEEVLVELGPQAMCGSFRSEVLRIIEEDYGRHIAEHVRIRINGLRGSELKALVAYCKMWASDFKSTDEDEVRMAVEACVGRGVDVVEVLRRIGLINRAHRVSTSRYVPKVYVPKYVEPILLELSERELELRLDIEDPLSSILAEDPLKACVAVYGIDEVIDELVKSMTGLSTMSLTPKLTVEGFMKAGVVCPLLRGAVQEAWRRVVEKSTRGLTSLLRSCLLSCGFSVEELLDEELKMPLTLAYGSKGLEVALCFSPSVLPVKPLMMFNPDCHKSLVVEKLNAPPREAVKFLRLTSLVRVDYSRLRAQLYCAEAQPLKGVLEAGGLSVEVQEL